MKKAIAYISPSALLTMLRLPIGINLLSAEYPSNGDSIKIVIEGDALPVNEVSPNAKRLPEVDFILNDSWHKARIDVKESAPETETTDPIIPRRKYTKKTKSQGVEENA